MKPEPNNHLQALSQAIVQGLVDEAGPLAEKAVAAGMKPLQVIEQACVPAIEEVGRLWEAGDYFLPELIAGAEAMKAAMTVLQEALKSSGQSLKSAGRVVIGTVEGDIHDIGKNLVASMLRASGFEVIDLGADVKVERFVETAEREKADIIALSALLTTTMLNQKRVVELLVSRGLKDKFKVMVGGAPVTEKFAREIGADGYGESAVQAVSVARSLLAGRGGNHD
ncbi:MAG: corrinoid protein [Candidatus Saccharicenans sp.]|jgi:trimethylamine corrinoid protein|nr:corrinoid protein [Candidatus Saccharicenans sp.]MDH7574153.1 corrinoid protein [Candidatus Saccharicenans sp.]